MTTPALIEIDDASDARLGDYTRLRDVSLRRHLEAERGLYIAEGTKVIERAVAAGHVARSLLLARRWLADLAPALEALGERTPNLTVFVADEAVTERVTGFHVHRGALGAFERPADRPLPQVVANAQRIIVLEDIVDHTNVGAAFRSAAALGFDAVVLAPRCADPLYRRSVKVSMGAVFELPYTRLTDWHGAMGTLSDLGFVTVAMTPAAGSEPLRQIAADLRDERVALVFGTEGDGLTDRWLQTCARRVRIPMHRGIDSLNVAASVAVACYAFSTAD